MWQGWQKLKSMTPIAKSGKNWLMLWQIAWQKIWWQFIWQKNKDFASYWPHSTLNMSCRVVSTSQTLPYPNFMWILENSLQMKLKAPSFSLQRRTCGLVIWVSHTWVIQLILLQKIGRWKANACKLSMFRKTTLVKSSLKQYRRHSHRGI